MKCSENHEVLGSIGAGGVCECGTIQGLRLEGAAKEVRNIYIALDATGLGGGSSHRSGRDMLLTHHPLIFKAIKKVK